MKPLGKLTLALLLASAAGATCYAVRTFPSPRQQPALAPGSSAPPLDAEISLDAEERRLVTGAEAALAQGDTDHAFSLLYEHATKFPNGKLSALRLVTHVRALCRVGKTAEAREEAASFLAQNPNSPLASQVPRDCASPP